MRSARVLSGDIQGLPGGGHGIVDGPFVVSAGKRLQQCTTPLRCIMNGRNATSRLRSSSHSWQGQCQGR